MAAGEESTGGAAPVAGARLRAVAARARPYGPALAASAALGAVCVYAILDRAGHPALPLDDAFIHMQFARRLAEGAFFSYVPGEGYSSGATSLLWPVVLAPFHAIGFRGLALVWVVWALGTLFHAALAVETTRLARPLAGRAAALAAGAMCTAFGAFAWFAWSGMETVALAWILVRTARLAAARCEPDPRSGPPRAGEGALALALLGVAAPLVRPEGALASLFAALALAYRPPGGGTRARLLALAPLAGPLVAPAMHLALAGHARSSTAIVKWMVGNPHYDAAELWAAIGAHVRLLVTDLLDGGAWTALFLPEGARWPILLGAAALVVAGLRRRRPAHAALVMAIGLGTLIPCTYLSFLWNRVRYIWPFAPAWFVMAACLAREIGDAARRLRRPLAHVGPLVAGAFVGALAMKLPWAIRDLAESAHAVDRQQVRLGLWAAEHLPEDARVGVNDTGAIAYFGGRRTFDVVGLTTEGEARYWVAGAGSRFEHYETLPPEARPTHFIVYPHWMACPPVLGEELAEATVTDQSILGGATMVVYAARWDAVGSGAAPMRMVAGERVLDAIDVADLASERAHAYERRGGTDQDNQAFLLAAPESTAPGDVVAPRAEVADGGRMNRRADRFAVALAEAPAEARLVLRVAADEDATLAITVGGEPAGEVEIPAGAWVERAVALPAARLAGRADVEAALRRGSAFHAFHYWIAGR